MLGLEHITVAGNDQRVLTVGDGQHRFKPTQHAVGAPVLGQFHRAAQQIALVLVEFGFEALEQREGVGRAAGKTGKNVAVVERAHLARRCLDDDVAQRDLTIPAQGDAIATPHGQDGGAAVLFHDDSSSARSRRWWVVQ